MRYVMLCYVMSGWLNDEPAVPRARGMCEATGSVPATMPRKLTVATVYVIIIIIVALLSLISLSAIDCNRSGSCLKISTIILKIYALNGLRNPSSAGCQHTIIITTTTTITTSL